MKRFFFFLLMCIECMSSQAQNISTGIDNLGNALAVAGSDPEWSIVSSPLGATVGIVCPSYLPYWENTPIATTNARWLNPDALYYNETPGDYVYERDIVVAPGTSLLNLNFGMAWDDNLVLAELVPPTPAFPISLTFIPSTSGSYFISPVPTPSTVVSPVAGVWKLRITVNYFDSVGAFMLSGSVDAVQDSTCQCPNLSFSAGSDITTSSTATLSATAGFDAYSWSPATSLDDPTIASPLASPSSTTTYTCTATHLGTELIVNGDFSMGNVGFATGYNYSTFAPCNYTTQPDAWSPSSTDHTTTTDNAALMVDGCYTPNTLMWAQQIDSICENTDYQFSLWMTRTDIAPQQIEVKFNGVSQTIFLANLPPFQYDQFIYNWNSGANTSVGIMLTDLELAGYGNDFIIDDISFRQACFYQDSVTVSLHGTAIDEQILSDVRVYPQPAQDVVTISYPEKVQQLSLYDMQGKLLQNVAVSPAGKTELDISSLSHGLYFLQINGLYMKKMLK